jgi:ATP-dependent RNA helicase SUPV3L1/SUV3
MTNTSHAENFAAHYGALQAAEKRGDIRFHTLSSLGFKRSADAARAGYILIRGSFALGQRTMPAIWLAPTEMPQFEQICQLAENERLAEKDRKLSEQDQKQKDLNKLMSNHSPFQQKIAEDELKRQPKRSIDRIKADVERIGRLMDAIAAMTGHENISLDTPISAIKSNVLLRYACSINLPGGLGSKKEYRISLSATSSVQELQSAVQHVQLLHDRLSHDLQNFVRLAHQWKHLLAWTHWMSTLKKAKENTWTLAEMIDRVCQSSCSDVNAQKKIQEICLGEMQHLSFPHPIINVGFQCDSYILATAYGLEIKVKRLNQVLANAILNTSDILPAGTALQQGLIQEITQTAIRCAQHLQATQQQLRKSISLAFNDEMVSSVFSRFTPKSITQEKMESALSTSMHQTIAHFSALLSVSDLINKYGDDWVVSRYVHARALRRRVVIYAGPTNSGKTYSAYKDVAHAQSILYLAPLRLLAMEGYDTLRTMGFDASLLTGEERIGPADARYVASTVEMCNPNRIFDAAIVDEAQMLCDPDRGSAWTAALLGVPAKNLYLTCPDESVDMLLSLFKLTKENVEVIRLERKSSLTITSHPTPVKDVKPGTAFIAFSRRDLLGYKEVFESRGMTCALVYGALSPEVRRAQAELFSSGQADVLLSTDAISMGLNLPIQHIVLSDSKKFNGKSVANVEPALLRQIAGRAGRYGIKEGGLVSGINKDVHKAVVQSFEHINTFHLGKYPVGLDQDMVEVLSAAYHTNKLSEISESFKKVIESSASDFTAKCQPIQTQMFGFVDTDRIMAALPLSVRFTASCAPVNDDNYGHWAGWVERLADGIVTPVPQLSTPAQITGDARALKKVEEDVALLNTYRWMHYQFPEAFPDLAAASALLKEKDHYIHESLKKSIKKRCLECGCTLSMQWLHARCDDCYHGRRDYDD